MQPISPCVADAPEVVFAKDQPQYLALPSVVSNDGIVTTRWKLSWRERLSILLFGELWHQQLTFHHPPQPIKMGTELPEELK